MIAVEKTNLDSVQGTVTYPVILINTRLATAEIENCFSTSDGLVSHLLTVISRRCFVWSLLNHR